MSIDDPWQIVTFGEAVAYAATSSGPPWQGDRRHHFVRCTNEEVFVVQRWCTAFATTTSTRAACATRRPGSD